ncbi:hypothetical protein HZB93_01005 [Candidatus Falkowbacteria bacterium]|nr:hypothetical protein [Candidatus Falkowbacteria bacterium]
MAEVKDYQDLMKKINDIKKEGKIDLSVDEDLSIAIMNLVSLEEHFFFTAEKTGKEEYYKFLETIREMRKEFLGMMIKQYEGEVWCISKHLLAASMRLMEVGTKMQSHGQPDLSKNMFHKSYELFKLFFSLRLNLIRLPEIKKEDVQKIDLDKPWTKEEILNKLLDCCKE